MSRAVDVRSLTACSTPVMLGAVGGAALGALASFGHPAFADQVVVSLATVGANVGATRLRARRLTLGDLLVLATLVTVTTTVAGWNLARLPGAVIGLLLGALVARSQCRASQRAG